MGTKLSGNKRLARKCKRRAVKEVRDFLGCESGRKKKRK